MTGPTAPSTRASRATAAREWSAAGVRTALVAYGFVLAIIACAWWSHGIPTSQVQLQGSRQTLIARSIAVLDQGGPPMLASGRPYKEGLRDPSVFYPANEGDDQGIYLYLPVAGHLLGDRNPLSLEKWFAVGAMALVPLLYPLLFFVLFESLAAAALVPLVAVGAVRDLINVDIYWAAAWILLLGLPIVFVAAQTRNRPRLSLGLLAIAALLASFATSIRVHAGLGVALAALAVAVVQARGWRRRTVAAAFVIVAYLSIATFAFAGVRAYRDHVSHMPSSSLPNTHGIWHATYLGLGYLPNSWGVRWDDSNAFYAAQAVDPNVQSLTPHYEHIIRHLYFSDIKAEPGWAVHLYLVKLAVLVRAGLQHYWYSLILVPLLLFLGPAARRFRLQVLLLLPSLLLAMVPALLALPLTYDAGFLGALALLSFLVLAAVVCALGALGRALPSVPARRLLEEQTVAATAVERRAWLRTVPAALRGRRRGVVQASLVAAATALVLAAGWGATAMAAANDDPIYYYANETLVSKAPPGSTVIRTWRPPFATWSPTGSAVVSTSGAGAHVQTTSAVGAPQFESPVFLLRPGAYAILASGAVSRGGIAVDAWLPDQSHALSSGQFWYGQTGLNKPGMLATFTLSTRTQIQVVLANWAGTEKPSAWSVRRVTLLRLPAKR